VKDGDRRLARVRKDCGRTLDSFRREQKLLKRECALMLGRTQAAMDALAKGVMQALAELQQRHAACE